MESHHLSTRTYTALTCQLIVSDRVKQRFSLNPRTSSELEPQNIPVDFTLHLDDPERGDLDRITLKGQIHQLNLLQQVVSKHITELVARFPLPIMNNNTTTDPGHTTTADRHQDTPAPEMIEENSIGSKLYPKHDSQSTTSGLMNNLPGLRNNLQSIAASDTAAQPNPVANSGISKFFGAWKKQPSRQDSSAQAGTKYTPLGAAASVKSGFGKREVENLVAKSPSADSATAPHLTSIEGSLDSELHLGDLANSTSGESITLSPIQLFDLSTVVDEYVAADVPSTSTPTPTVTFSKANIPVSEDLSGGVDSTTSALARLPNLPRAAGKSQTSQVFNRTQNYGVADSFMSVIPWAAAAAVAVGGTLFLLDSNPNPLKDATSKVKMPSLEGVQKNVTAFMKPPAIDGDPTNSTLTTETTPTTATAPALPTPWEAKPVKPPQTITPVTTATQPPQTGGKIGIASLPTLSGKPGQDFPNTAGISGQNTKPAIGSTLPRNEVKSGIAPNPLSADRSPAAIKNAGIPTGLPSAKIGTTTNIPTTKNTGLPVGRLTDAITPGTVSVSTQPILLPSDLPNIGINSANPPQTPVNPVKIETAPVKAKKVVAKIATSKTIKPKKVAAKIAKSKAAKPKVAAVIRQPLFEPSSPVQASPILIEPVQPQIPSDIPDFQNLPVVPVQPFPSSSDQNWLGNATQSRSLKETQAYFQSKWKANQTQPESLQYVVQVSGKSGIVRSIAPQGEAAKVYLQKNKLVKVGQKLVSSAASTDEKIWVVLQPDGHVDTFIQP